MKKENVTHRGIIAKISGNTVTLRTDDICRCDGCAVAMMCNKGESSEGETITVDIDNPASFAVGDRVEITASSASTLMASLWALIIPTVLFIATILGVRFGWPGSGAWSILAGFIVLALYDLGLFLARKRIAVKVRWSVERV